MDARHEEAAEEDLVEFAVGAAWILVLLVSGLVVGEGKDGGGARRTSEEFVQLDEELEVGVVALGSFAVRGPHMMSVEIDT